MSEVQAAQVAKRESRFRKVIRRMRNPTDTFVDATYEMLGSKWCGNTMPPLDHHSYYFSSERVASFTNDAFDVYIGYTDRWETHFRRDELHRFIRWYLRKWAFGEWFGLRRIVWYWALSKRVERYRNFNKETK